MNDKIKHLAVGGLFGIATYFSNYWLLGAVIATIIFVGKEVSDMYDINLPFYHHKATGFDEIDLAVDFIGLTIGFFIGAAIQQWL